MSKFKRFFSCRNSLCLTGFFVVALSLLLISAGCDNSDDDHNNAQADQNSLVFTSVEAPVTDDAKRVVQASPSVEVNGVAHNIGYQILMRSGDSIGGATFGLILDQNGVPVVENDGSQFISNDNDFSSLLKVGGKLYCVTHFESRPGAMYLTELSQDTGTGILTAVSTRSVDFSAWGGLWVPCAGSVTPWGNHLGSEEYPPDARVHEDALTTADIEDYDKPMLRYFGIVDPFAESVTLDDIHANFNSYRYGYPVEVAVSADGGATVNKRYAMGRVAVELAYVMPDQKTVYISDDGTNVGFFLFLADAAGNLSAGNLYAAKWVQAGADNGGSATIQWIPLGHATQDEIAPAVASGVKFYDIFDAAEPNEDNTCPAGYISVNTEDSGHECLSVKSGMEKIASRLETRRYAAMLGATTEFRKEEGITFDPDNNILYVAMSEVNSGMEDNMKGGKANNKYDKGGPNDIRLPYNDCGAVYALEVGPDASIGSDYVVRNMAATVNGVMTTYDASSPYAGNTCAIDGIANPDNLTFIRGYKTLIIGEDTGSGHQNDAIWAYNVETKELTRIETTPYGSETTSPYIYPDINGWAYLMSVVQHPYGESDQDKLSDPSSARAYVGYIGPMPALN